MITKTIAQRYFIFSQNNLLKNRGFQTNLYLSNEYYFGLKSCWKSKRILIKNIKLNFIIQSLMVKLSLKGSQDPADSSLQMKIRQYLVLGRKLPTEQQANPKVFAIRLFARNKVIAKSKFWYHLRRQLKTKSAQGQILSVNEIFERRPNHIKTFGIVLRYESRTGNHNMYKEYRDVSLNGAVSQLHSEMAGNHRASPDTISIIRTAVLNKKEEIRRPRSVQYRDSKVKFPILRTATRASHKRYRSIFKANRPNTFRQ